MPSFSVKSRGKLKTCEYDLQTLFEFIVKEIDCTILEGYRDEETQNRCFHEGRSKVKFPDGRHNEYPSRAVDVAPYPIDFNDRDRFHFFAGYVRAIADELGIKLRWGGNWANDLVKGFKRNNFDDLVHFELVE
jgi:peptidoglycan L-alanyl-D-glutamate endopeptidase CwlK